MESAFKYEMWELLRHEKFPGTHVLAILLTGNACCLMDFVVVVVLLFIVHHKQLRSCRDGQLT